jgi:hypothetical protein
VYNGDEKDFADMFDITNSGPVTTGYYSTAYNGDDLGKIFRAGNSGIQTSYFDSSNIDLGNIFALPSPPDNPLISPDTCYKQITLNWTDSDPTITSYNIYKDTDPAINVSSSTVTYTFTGLTNGTTYSVNVKAVNPTGESSNSPINVLLPATSTNFTGYNSSSVSGSNTTLTFTSSGTLTYTCSELATNILVSVVGGGGSGCGVVRHNVCGREGERAASGATCATAASLMRVRSSSSEEGKASTKRLGGALRRYWPMSAGKPSAPRSTRSMART